MEVKIGKRVLCLLLCISLCIPSQVQFAEAEGNGSYPFCSDYSLYTRNGKNIEQRAFGNGGTLFSSFRVKNLKELWWVDNGWIYYSVSPSGHSMEELWRVPFSQAEGAEQILWDAKEQLLKDEYINALCIWHSYIVYRGSKTYYRYDLQSKTSLALNCKGKQKFIPWTEFISTLQNVPLVKDGYTFLGDPHYTKHFYCLDIERWSIQKISGPKLDYDQLVATDQAFFYVSGDQLWKYNPITNKSSLFMDKKTMNRTVQEINPSSANKKVKWGIHSIHGDDDNVYLQIMTWWMQREGKAGSEENREHYRMIILSLQQDTPFELRYEKGLSDCLQEKSKRQYLRRYDNTADSGEVWNIVDGNCILLLYDDARKGKKKYKIREGYYSLKTGAFKYITKRDSEYWIPDYIGANQPHDCAMGYE